MELVTIKTYASTQDALVDKSILEDANIPSVLLDQNVNRLYAHSLLVECRLQVAKPDVKKALEILASPSQVEEQENIPVDDEDRCPKCRSDKVESVKIRVRKDNLPLLGLLFATPMRSQPDKWLMFCPDCHYVWDPENIMKDINDRLNHMILCNHCDTSILRKNINCPECGKTLEFECDKCHGKVSNFELYCFYCGVEL